MKYDFTLAKQVNGQDLDSNWIFEQKFDGSRCMIIKKNNKVELVSRKGNYNTHKFPNIVKVLNENIPNNTILDSELIAKNGKFKDILKRTNVENNFKIQRYTKLYPAKVMIFDILELKGNKVTKKPLIERKKLLNDLKYDDDFVDIVTFYENKDKLIEYTKENDLEGVMAKRKDSFYTQDRSSDWLKIKNWQESDLTIYGYTSKTRDVSSVILGKEGIIITKCNLCGILNKTYGGKLQDIVINNSDTITRFKLSNLDKDEEVYWVEPKFKAKVKYLEKCENGFRFPILRDIYERNTKTY